LKQQNQFSLTTSTVE